MVNIYMILALIFLVVACIAALAVNIISHLNKIEDLLLKQHKKEISWLIDMQKEIKSFNFDYEKKKRRQ